MPVLQALFMLPVQEEGGTERANCPPMSISPPCSVKEPQVFIWLQGHLKQRLPSPVSLMSTVALELSSGPHSSRGSCEFQEMSFRNGRKAFLPSSFLLAGRWMRWLDLRQLPLAV